MRRLTHEPQIPAKTAMPLTKRRYARPGAALSPQGEGPGVRPQTFPLSEKRCVLCANSVSSALKSASGKA
jgi:hypothetical protein